MSRRENHPSRLRLRRHFLDRLDDLVSDLADVMREGELVSDVTTVDLEDTVRTIWESLETGDAMLAFGTTGAVRADEDALMRIVENLLKNALDHEDDDVTVTVGVCSDGFYVEDGGPGIPEAERDRVFDAGHSTKGDGQGFGLASGRQLAIAHGWEVTAT